MTLTRVSNIIGIGMHPYQPSGRSSYVSMGLQATRESLSDAGIDWTDVETAYVATITLGLGAGWRTLRYLGATGVEVTQVANASASGSTAFRKAVKDVETGQADVALALGLDIGKMPPLATEQDLYPNITGGLLPPAVELALETQRYMDTYDVTLDEIAAVAVKNSANGALNPYAQRKKPLSIEEVNEAVMVATPLSANHMCPVGEGAAAVLVASDEAIKRLGIDGTRSVRVAGSVSMSEYVAPGNDFSAEYTTGIASRRLYEESGIGPEDIDILELHEAFTVEEYIHTEAMGLYEPGEGPRFLADGHSRIGGKIAISPSGGLLAMGHPFGPTGIGQVNEITRQLRGEATGRQHPDARVGVAHMVGVGNVCVMHTLVKD